MNCSGCEARFPKSVISLLSMIVSVLSDPPFTQWTTILLTPHTISTHTSFPVYVSCVTFLGHKNYFLSKCFPLHKGANNRIRNSSCLRNKPNWQNNCIVCNDLLLEDNQGIGHVLFWTHYRQTWLFHLTFHYNLYLKWIISIISYIFFLWNLFETKIVAYVALDPFKNLLHLISRKQV